MFKGIPVPDKLLGLIDHMKDLQTSREDLSVLGQQWDLLAILGKMNDDGTDMTRTREDFANLTSELLGALGVETLNKTTQSLAGKAQVAVDIVIRNLFERTADIGFLATDDDIRNFLVGLKTASAAEDFQSYKNNLDTIRTRFADYVAKYSVYENIILLDAEGAVVAALVEDDKVQRSSDPLLKESLETNAAFVETFRATDLCPQADKSLIYSYRVTESNDPKSKPLGVLCLVFRFENELDGVFKNLLSESDWTVLTLVDKDGRVIGSSDYTQIPLQSRMPLSLVEDFKITKFGGRLYLAKTCATKGYQGFMGLGWYGHAMIPLERAFDALDDAAQNSLEPSLLEAMRDEPRLFSEQLRSIPRSAETIQSELDRTVWNGNIALNDAEAAADRTSSRKVLLWEISTTGKKTKKVFEKSIRDLHETVITSILNDAAFASSLAIDIMDRNLYERADDCRWWALTTAFRKILSQTRPSQEGLDEISKILGYINGLYTVYTSLFVYDAQGAVVAVSKPSQASLVGQTLKDSYVQKTLGLNSPQKYSVSPFSRTDLYEDGHTYIYGAAIRHPENEKVVVGGIGIVFDSKPQFSAILNDALPRDHGGKVRDGAFALFVDREKMILSSSSPEYSVGSRVDFPAEFFNLANGETLSKIIEFKGQFYAVGIRTSQGYREYKSAEDDYKNDVIAVSFILLGQATDLAAFRSKAKAEDLEVKHSIRSPGVSYREFATFYIGDVWMGVDAKCVVESILVDKLTPIPGSSETFEGTVIFRDLPIAVLNAHKVFGQMKLPKGGKQLVVVLKTENQMVGLIVDRLGEIPQVEDKNIRPVQNASSQGLEYIEGIVAPDHSRANPTLLITCDATKLAHMIFNKSGGSGSIAKGLAKVTQLPTTAPAATATAAAEAQKKSS